MSDVLSVSFDVRGTPAPKGSGRAIMRGGRPVHVPSGSDANKRSLKSWDVAVRVAAHDALGGSWTPPFVGEPLRVAIVFRMARPGGHWGRRGLKPSAPSAPAKKPDIDKLARATLDAIIGSIIDDDSRIVELRLVKQWADPGDEGATISVSVARGTEAA